MQEAIFVLYRSRKPTRRHLKRRENTLTMQASTKDVDTATRALKTSTTYSGHVKLFQQAYTFLFDTTR